jgi:diguanylate cyclase (GGDEF)-like protein
MRILVADDTAISRRLLEGTLTRLGHEVITVEDGLQAIDALLAADGPRIAILDWMMPGADGLEVCREIRRRSDTYIYLILLTGRDGETDMVTGLDSGADDFLTKPFNSGELRARLRSGSRVLDLQNGLLEAQEALRALALRDHLTGLDNRRAILAQLDRELNRARHEKRPLAVALVDLDHFKQINDTRGHAEGDAVLKRAAGALKSQLRQYDFIGRYGGEEFLVVLPGCNLEMAMPIAERLRSIVPAEPSGPEASQASVTVSIGVASTDVFGIKPDPLIAAADAALYRAKARGRNQVAT